MGNLKMIEKNDEFLISGNPRDFWGRTKRARWARKKDRVPFCSSPNFFFFRFAKKRKIKFDFAFW